MRGPSQPDAPFVTEKPFFSKATLDVDKYLHLGIPSWMPIIGRKPTTKFKEPIAFIIKENNEVDILENVASGPLNIRNNNGKARTLVLDPSKKLAFKYGGKYLQGWIASENDGSVYPLDAEHDSETLYNLIRKIESENKELDSNDMFSGKIWGYLLLLGGVLAIIYVANVLGVFNPLWAAISPHVTATPIPPEAAPAPTQYNKRLFTSSGVTEIVYDGVVDDAALFCANTTTGEVLASPVTLIIPPAIALESLPQVKSLAATSVEVTFI